MNNLKRFSFSFNTSIYRFLNDKAINILQIIFRNPEVPCKTLIYLIKKRISISRSTSFRYLNSLHNNNLIKKKMISNRSKLAHIFYDLTLNGKEMLLLFKKFIVKKILLVGLLAGKEICNIDKICIPNIYYLESQFWYKFRYMIIFGGVLTVNCEINLINKEGNNVNFMANCFDNVGRKVLKTAIFGIPFDLGDLKLEEGKFVYE